jgi:hypothetical protein
MIEDKACVICGEIKPIHIRGMCRLCYGRERYAFNRERIDELRKKRWPAYYAKNKERMKQATDRYRISAKAKRTKAIYDRKRRNIIRFGGMATGVYERAMNRCEKCGSANALQIHHIDGHSYHNGTPNNDPGNLLLVCALCHRRIHATRAPCPDATKAKISARKIVRDMEYQKKIAPRKSRLRLSEGQQRSCTLCGLISARASVIDLIRRIPEGFDPVYRVPRKKQREDALSLQNGTHWLCRNGAKCRRRRATPSLRGSWQRGSMS